MTFRPTSTPARGSWSWWMRRTLSKPTLLLAPLFTEDSEALWRAALKAGWSVERVRGWSVPEGLGGADLAYYGSLRAAFVALLMEALAHVLLEPPPDWPARIP